MSPPPYENLPLDRMSDRELLIAVLRDVGHLTDTMEELGKCNKEMDERMKKVENFQAGVVATNDQLERSARRTAQTWALIIAVISFIVTVTVDIGIHLVGVT